MAAALRRRVLPNEASSDTPTGTPSPAPTAARCEPRDASPEKKEHKIHKVKVVHGESKGKKRRFTLIFFLGILFGLVAAGFLAKSNDLIDFPEIGELSMDSLLDALPAGLVKDMRDLVVSICARDAPACAVADFVAGRVEWGARFSG